MYEPGELIRKQEETDASISTDEEGESYTMYNNDSIINYDKNLKKKKKKLVEVEFYGAGDLPPLLPLEHVVKTKTSPHKSSPIKSPNKKMISAHLNKYNSDTMHDYMLNEVDEDLELLEGFIAPRLDLLAENTTIRHKNYKHSKERNEIKNQKNNEKIEFNNDFISTNNLDKLLANGGNPIQSNIKNNNSHIILKPNQRIRVYPSNKSSKNTFNYINEDNIRKEVNKLKLLNSL